MQRVIEESFIVRCSALHSGFHAYKNLDFTVQQGITFYKILSLLEIQYALNGDAANIGKRKHYSTAHCCAISVHIT